jgi:thiol-disulfide isomerase/thioredoxin
MTLIVQPGTRCGPCVRAGPELSDLAEEHAGRVAIVGVNNESIFYDRGHDVEKVRSFLEENKDGFRYTVYVDTLKGHAKECKWHTTARKLRVESECEDV